MSPEFSTSLLGKEILTMEDSHRQSYKEIKLVSGCTWNILLEVSGLIMAFVMKEATKP